ncbi:hypothetical protein I5I61_13175 [Pseudomonas nitroreducens]|uniref:DUF1837 domain-containing protein n=1 Tax=Pseudomonas nitroreducens TaxID=46680 RepID=A0ABS0KK23_PSENT|nr:hypothetical protein [Pseudomonas nitroreducens]MBG6288400.1 hypothetical protein [Pseudomonas nitroreducens]
MQVISCAAVDLVALGKNSECILMGIHVRISDIDVRAEEMLNAISDTSWIDGFGAVKKIAFQARAKRTVAKLVELIKSRSSSSLSTDFGEYLVSDSAQCVLDSSCSHTKVPLAELLKEKVSGNPGFDFHTESQTGFIAFGEAKYSGKRSPYTKALEQIIDFIGLEKDSAELDLLENFVSAEAVQRYIEGHKAYVAAFSINSDDPAGVLTSAISHAFTDKLLGYRELYLIGVEIDAG